MLSEFAEEKKNVFRNFDRICYIVLAVLAVLYVSSGIYLVQANEQGVLRRFGAVRAGTVGPGIHYRLPWPVDRVDKVRIKEVKRIEVGFWPGAAEDEDIILPYCITGDGNIIHNQFVIQYRVVDPAKYIIRTKEPARLLISLAKASIIKVVARKSVDPVLTTGKRRVENEIMKQLQDELDRNAFGILISSIETKSVTPPNMVSDSFKDVINAQEEKTTTIHEAENYKNKIIPEAKAEAKKIIEEAEAFKFKRVNAAEGESSRFLNVYSKYKAAPKPMRDRMFLQVVETVLPRVKVYVLATDARGRPMKIKLLRGAFPTIPQLQSLGK